MNWTSWYWDLGMKKYIGIVKHINIGDFSIFHIGIGIFDSFIAGNWDLYPLQNPHNKNLFYFEATYKIFKLSVLLS